MEIYGGTNQQGKNNNNKTKRIIIIKTGVLPNILIIVQ